MNLWGCKRDRIYCANLSQPSFKVMCKEEPYKTKCAYTCDTCNKSNDVHYFTVAGLMDSVLDMLLRDGVSSLHLNSKKHIMFDLIYW